MPEVSLNLCSGNGRTGRILNLLFLVEKQLIDVPILYLSRYIIKNKTDYYVGLRKVTEEDNWEGWVLFILRAVEITARDTLNKVNRILAIMEDVRTRVEREELRIYSHDLINMIFYHPHTKIQFLIDGKIAKRQTASIYLRKLVALGVLRELQKGREKYYINQALWEELVN